MGRRGETSRGGVMCWLWLLAVVLVCAGTLVKPEGAGPIYVAVNLPFLLRGDSGSDEHGFLYSSGLTVA